MSNSSPKSRKTLWAMLWMSALGLLFLSGCVYMRLLEVKRHLRDFDNHFAIEGTTDWIVVCKTPVMLSKDMIYLIGAAPMTIESRDDVDHWHYEFERVPSEDDHESHPMDHLSLEMEMTGGKMSRFIVPPSFTQLFSHRVLSELLRSTPNAEILELRKTMVAHDQLSPEADADLPSKEKTLSLLGRPLQSLEEGKWETLIYRYRIVKEKREVPIIARMSFSSDGRLRRVVVHWDTSTADAEFIRPSRS